MIIDDLKKYVEAIKLISDLWEALGDSSDKVEGIQLAYATVIKDVQRIIDRNS